MFISAVCAGETVLKAERNGLVVVACAGSSKVVPQFSRVGSAWIDRYSLQLGNTTGE